jgi:hypothetical protein
MTIAICSDSGLSPVYIDANRKERCAFTDPDARPFYAEYHDRITSYVDEIRWRQFRGYGLTPITAAATSADALPIPVIGSRQSGQMLISSE